MRTIIDIPEDQLAARAEYCEQRRISRAEAIREAVALLIDTEEGDLERAFGSWKDHTESTDEYLERIRSEWER